MAPSVEPVQRRRDTSRSAPALSARLRQFVVKLWLKTINAVYKMQLAHYGGKYSIERMLAFEEYTRSTSLLRAFVVITSPPVFTAAVLLCQENVPLQDPREGWIANWGFWLRVGVLGIANGHEAITQVPPWLKVPTFTARQIAVFSVLTAVGFVAGGMVVSELWVFPIPFFLVTISLLLFAVLIGLLRVVAGGPAFTLIASRKEELKRLNNVATLETLMCAGYPAYQVLFTTVNHTPYELPVILLLSVIKLVMKRIFRSAATHEEDMIPKQVVFTVDLFNAFYLATFMQRLAPTTLVVVMLVDIVESAIELHELQQRTRGILARLNEMAYFTHSNEDNGNLLAAIRTLLISSEGLQKEMRTESRVRSCITHQLSIQSRTLLETMDSYAAGESSDKSIRHSQGKSHRSLQFASVVPLPRSERGSPPTPSKAQNPHVTKRERVGRRQSTVNEVSILQESLEVIFTSECLVLTEYVETIMPIIYGVFILVTVHLPSAQYHSEMEGVTLDNVGGMVSRMFVYALLEVLSFVALAVITKRNCGIHVLHQVAFVLESEIAFVPSKLILWVLYTLTYRVAHFGPDFSFQFEWIRNSSS